MSTESLFLILALGPILLVLGGLIACVWLDGRSEPIAPERKPRK